MKNLLFDLDGTIIEPKEGILNSIRHTAQKMGVVAPSDETLHQFIGPPIMESFQHKLGLTYEQALEAVGYFRSYYAHTGIHQNALFPYVDELLKALKVEGYTLFVATSKPTLFAKEILKDHQLDTLFVEIVGCNMDNSRSDKAEIIAYIVEKYGLDVSECLMIGDTKYDIIGAKKHAMLSVGVNYGHGDFSQHIPQHTVDSCEELEVLIKKYFPLG
ncbi:MAG: HAD-IA family hydrolase [Flavobacteriales bacterium]|nr:HAD-IA family hydrolase [Flavobacteriales bacterium]